jgi:hypothetical protein
MDLPAPRLPGGRCQRLARGPDQFLAELGGRLLADGVRCAT